MTLRRRLLVLIALVLPLSLLAGGLLTYLYSVRLVQNEMTVAVEHGEATVREVVESIHNTPDATSQIARLVASFDNDHDIRVSHISNDGKVVAASRLAPIWNLPPEWLQRALASQIEQRMVELPGELRRLGSLKIEGTPINEISEVWDEMTLQFLLMAGFFSLVLWLVSWTLGRALRPLEDLSAALSEVGAGNFTAHVPEAGPQELAAIYREFNRMANRLKDAEVQNKSLNVQLSTVQEEERADIARDLHDEIGPFLFAADVDAQTIPQYLKRGLPEEAAARASAIRQSVAHMQTHLRSILSRLRPAALLDLGLAQAVDQQVHFWQKRHPAIAVEADIGQASFGAKLDEVAFRTIQEALSNAVRHGRPARVAIKAALQDNNRLAVSIIDDGVGIQGGNGTGFGLAGMRERVLGLGGTLTISAGPEGKGTKVLAEIPAAISAAAEAGNDERAKATEPAHAIEERMSQS